MGGGSQLPWDPSRMRRQGRGEGRSPGLDMAPAPTPAPGRLEAGHPLVLPEMFFGRNELVFENAERGFALSFNAMHGFEGARATPPDNSIQVRAAAIWQRRFVRSRAHGAQTGPIAPPRRALTPVWPSPRTRRAARRSRARRSRSTGPTRRPTAGPSAGPKATESRTQRWRCGEAVGRRRGC